MMYVCLLDHARESRLPKLAAYGEAIGSSDEGFAHARVSGGMARTTHNHQFALWPGLSKFPNRDQWTAKVKTSMDQDPRNVCERTRVSQQYPVCKPGVVVKIVGHNARKRKLKSGLQAPGLWCALRGHRHQSCLPRAPLLCRLHVNGAGSGSCSRR